MKYKHFIKEGKLNSYNPLHQKYSNKYINIIYKINENNNKLFKSYPNNNLSDSEGLNKAYTNGKGYFIDGNKLCISGIFGKGSISGAVNDNISDISIPFNGVKYVSDRYKEVSKVLENNTDTDTIISHSLGSSVGAELIKIS